MSRESKKRTKEWLGKSPNIVLSRDVITQYSATGLSGVADHTPLTEGGDTDALGAALSYAGKAGALDGVVFTCSPAITEGQVDVALSLNGAVVASGALTSSATFRAHDFKAGDDTEQALAAGGVLEASYVISTELDPDGNIGRMITARILLSYEE